MSNARFTDSKRTGYDHVKTNAISGPHMNRGQPLANDSDEEEMEEREEELRLKKKPMMEVLFNEPFFITLRTT